jgi:hypothetical protein
LTTFYNKAEPAQEKENKEGKVDQSGTRMGKNKIFHHVNNYSLFSKSSSCYPKHFPRVQLSLDKVKEVKLHCKSILIVQYKWLLESSIHSVYYTYIEATLSRMSEKADNS